VIERVTLGLLSAVVLWCVASTKVEPHSEIYRPAPVIPAEHAVMKTFSCREQGYAVYKSCEMAKVKKAKG
jgi:hypothetical protein